MSKFRLAAAQMAVFGATGFDDFAQRIAASVEAAIRQDARLLVFPEYGAMTLTALLDDGIRADLPRQVNALQALRDDYVALHRELARRHGVYLLAGSFPWLREDGRVCNRAWLFGPEGHAGYQDKQVMTRFEREAWGISAGESLRVFDTALGCLGVNICYDVEFPMLARRQAEAGATLLLAPSCTDNTQGYWRVRIGAQARALENQCFVAQAVLVGDSPWSAAIDSNVGAAGVFAPPDLGFPENGVVAIGRMNEAGWLVADIDNDAVARVRAEGQVLNHRHWPEQWRDSDAALPPPERVRV